MRDDPATFNDADERFAAQIAAELGKILGTGIVIDEIELGPTEDDPARIRVLCLFDGGAETLEASGPTTRDAYNALIRSAAELRLALASRRMIAPI